MGTERGRIGGLELVESDWNFRPSKEDSIPRKVDVLLLVEDGRSGKATEEPFNFGGRPPNCCDREPLGRARSPLLEVLDEFMI